MPAEPPQRRNILFITSDQQRYDSLGCNGGTVARTPVIDRLAAEGMNYARAYNQNTVCMPARSTMLTGQYVRTHGVVANGIALPVDAPSVAGYLAEKAGYRTALLGKAHFEPGFDPDLHFEENARAARGDTGPWRGFDRSEQAMHAAAVGRMPRWPTTAAGSKPTIRSTCTASPASRGRAGRGHRGARDQEQPDPAGVVPHRLGGRPDSGLARSLGDDEPWFCWMSFPDPHHPWDPPESELAAFPGRTSTSPPGTRGRTSRSAPSWSASPLTGWPTGRHVPEHGGRTGGLRSFEAHRRSDP